MGANTNDKKKEIINAAIYLFSDKGYGSTSVQDIAKYCNISKATIYKLFNSKEEILVDIITYFNNNMLVLIENVNSNLTLSPKEKFIEKIYAFFSHFATKKDFALTLVQNESDFKGSIVEQAFTDSKLLFLNWVQDAIYEYFGTGVKEIIWDLTYSLRALINGFAYIFIMKRVIEKDYRDVSEFIVNSIISIANDHIKEEPLIPADSVKFLCSDKNFQYDKDFLISQWKNEIKEIRHTISNSFSLIENAELIESINHLDSEFNKDDKKPFIIDALLLYLNNFAALKTHVNYLRKIWIKVK